MEFTTDKEAIERESLFAKRVLGTQANGVAVVTTNKLRPDSKKCFHAFHFEPRGAVKVGDIQKLEDGSVRRIERIIHPSLSLQRALDNMESEAQVKKAIDSILR